MKKIILSFTIIIFAAIANAAFGQDTRVHGNFEKGTILIAIEDASEFAQSSKNYEDEIIGIATGNNNPARKSDLILKEGITKIRYNSENGIIKKGDLITSSSEAGVGMKSTRSGMVIGLALEDAPLSAGLIKARIVVQYIKQ